MALSAEARKYLVVATSSDSVGKELADALDTAAASAAAGANPVAAHVAPVTAANATDLASAETLANANKVAINALIASLVASGQMAST